MRTVGRRPAPTINRDIEHRPSNDENELGLRHRRADLAVGLVRQLPHKIFDPERPLGGRLGLDLHTGVFERECLSPLRLPARVSQGVAGDAGDPGGEFSPSLRVKLFAVLEYYKNNIICNIIIV